MITRILIIILTIGVFANIANGVDIPKTVAPFVHRYKQMKSNLCTSFEISRKSSKKEFITNAHCCVLALSKPTMIFVNDIRVYISKMDVGRDLCLLNPADPKITNDGKGIQLAEFNAVPMDKIFTIGFPAHYGKTISEGRFINYTKYTTHTIYLADALLVIAKGASGSPVMNEYGQLVGVVTSVDTVRPSYSQFIPLNQVKEFLKDVK